jgi:DNA-binding transcriptional ArsR family regulator
MTDTHDEHSTESTLPEMHLIATLEALKVFADPLRQQILETLFDGARTVKQIAADLDMAPTKLYYHINLMEEHGLIRVTDTRVVSGIIEKQYGVAAEHYRINRALLAPGQANKDDGLDTTIDALIDPMRADLRRSIATGRVDLAQDPKENRRLRIYRSTWSMAPERADAFYDRLNALLAEFTEHDDETDDAEDYSIVLFYYPSAMGRIARRRR